MTDKKMINGQILDEDCSPQFKFVAWRGATYQIAVPKHPKGKIKFDVITNIPTHGVDVTSMLHDRFADVGIHDACVSVISLPFDTDFADQGKLANEIFKYAVYHKYTPYDIRRLLFQFSHDILHNTNNTTSNLECLMRHMSRYLAGTHIGIGKLIPDGTADIIPPASAYQTFNDRLADDVVKKFHPSQVSLTSNDSFIVQHGPTTAPRRELFLSDGNISLDGWNTFCDCCFAFYLADPLVNVSFENNNVQRGMFETAVSRGAPLMAASLSNSVESAPLPTYHFYPSTAPPPHYQTRPPPPYPPDLPLEPCLGGYPPPGGDLAATQALSNGSLVGGCYPAVSLPVSQAVNGGRLYTNTMFWDSHCPASDVQLSAVDGLNTVNVSDPYRVSPVRLQYPYCGGVTSPMSLSTSPPATSPLPPPGLTPLGVTPPGVTLPPHFIPVTTSPRHHHHPPPPPGGGHHLHHRSPPPPPLPPPAAPAAPDTTPPGTVPPPNGPGPPPGPAPGPTPDMNQPWPGGTPPQTADTATNKPFCHPRLPGAPNVEVRIPRILTPQSSVTPMPSINADGRQYNSHMVTLIPGPPLPLPPQALNVIQQQLQQINRAPQAPSQAAPQAPCDDDIHCSDAAQVTL